ncbi:methylamine utilization protein MauE [Salinisphaera sp. S4-8]|uniref:MauE/DoxX family redox-associated membrane protein n=1 Tax=Salinisphaera sp. S4-8 TaxID=633357 RepID=UPI003342ADE5
MTAMGELASAAAGVFVLLVVLRAALHKALDVVELQGFVADYRLLPQAWVVPVSGLLVAIEFILAAGVALPLTRTAGLVGCALLFAGYGVAIGINLARGHSRIECGCGGAPQMLSASLLWRNAALIVLALFAAGVVPGPLAVADRAVAIAAGVFALAIYLLFEQLNANRVFLKKRGPL